MSSSGNINTKLESGVLSIVIDRPEKSNALTQTMYIDLHKALLELDSNPAARVGFITGTQDCFTAGNDLSDFLIPPKRESDFPAFRFIKALPKLEKPLVAAINGAAIGIGTTLLLHCDLVYAGDATKLQLPFASLGISPEAGSALLLPQLLGHQKAAELLLLCEPFDAETAHSLGLVNEVFSTKDYQAKAYEKAKQIALQPAKSMRVTKMLLKQHNADALADIIELELDHFVNGLNSPEAKEAVTAKLAKRKPDFSQFD